MTRYMTPGKAAKRLQVSRWTVLRWIDEGRFGVVKKGGFGVTSPNRIPADVVESVAEELGIDPPDSPNGELKAN